jgi:hypothetical protein
LGAPSACSERPPRRWRPALHLGTGDGEGVRGGRRDDSILDSRFDGAFLGGFAATNGLFRIDAEVLWAAVGGDRPDSPNPTVDADLYYGRGTFGVWLAKDLFAHAGVRRFALKYDIQIADIARFTRKPGLWDPIVGIGYPARRRKVRGARRGGGGRLWRGQRQRGRRRVQAGLEAGHFGLTGGYNYLQVKFKHEAANRTLEVKQTLSGPVAGIGLYF